MFAGLFDNGDFAASHLFVVLCTGLTFLAVQLALSARFYFRMRRQQRVINSLRQDFEQGRNDRRELLARPTNSSWVQWVISNYSADDSGAACNFTREDALQELDARVASNGDYLLLQRMGVMAPLLGVVLTVIGFYWLEIGEQDQSLQAIMLAVAPLVSGVGTGAVLALINQALLHVAGHRAESLRMTARDWFDTVIWSHVDLDSRAAAGRTVTAMDQLIASIGDASARYAHGASQIDTSTASMTKAAAQFQKIVQSFSTEMKDIPEALYDVRRATTASAAALEELIRVGSRAVANLDISIAAFRTTIDRDFTAAAKRQHRAGRSLSKSARQLEDATERIRSGSHGLKQAALASQASFERMDESLRKHVIGGNQHFRDGIEELTGRVAAFGLEVGALSAIVESVAGEFNKVTGGLVPSVSSLRETVDKRFVTAVSQQSAHVEAVNQSMQRLREAADGMSQGSTTLNAMLHEMSQFVSQTRATHETIAQAAGDLTEVGNQLQQSMKSDMTASQRTMEEVSTSLARITKQLSEFVTSGIDPATQRLAVLHDTLADFEDAVNAFGEFEDAGPNDRLVESPTQLAEPDSQSGFMSWLSRRPR